MPTPTLVALPTMHVPDGFLDAPTSLATAAVSIVVVALALSRSRRELDERTAPLAGLTAVFVFAVQMLNFPVGVGTSGHLLGGALAAVLVGPWTAILVMTVVLTVQAVFFADGGLSALGTNILLMGIVTVLVGWVVTKAVLAVLPARPTSVVPAAFVGALLSVPASAAAFVLLYVVGGATELPFGPLLATMLGWHTLIGLGEAFITAATVGAVVAVRPDLVYAARGMRQELVLRSADGSELPVAAETPDATERRSPWPVVLVGGAVALLLAGVVSFFASGNPDGLEYVAGEQGFLEDARDHLLGDLALADYGDVGGIPVGLAGVLGVAVTALLGWLLFRWLGGRGAAPSQPADDSVPADR
jgi:cobalt/nickel transport system permease protein